MSAALAGGAERCAAVRWLRRITGGTLVRAAPILALGAAACGSAAAPGPSPCPTTPPSGRVSSPRAQTGDVSLTADAGTVAVGHTVALVARITGPASVEAPCSAPAELVVIDHGGVHVFAASPAAVSGEPCGSLRLAAGDHADFPLRWTPDITLPSGVYAATVTVGDQPAATVQLRLGRRPEEPCR